MKVLGIDTSSLATSVAVIEDNKLICEYTINTKKTHSQKLMPMIENMLNISDLNINFFIETAGAVSLPVRFMFIDRKYLLKRLLPSKTAHFIIS